MKSIIKKQTGKSERTCMNLLMCMVSCVSVFQLKFQD